MGTLNDSRKTRFPSQLSKRSPISGKLCGGKNAIVLPGRIPGFKSDDVKVLSSSETKIGAWRVYETACRAADKRAVSYSKFLQIWGQFYPNVVVSKPMTDLCMTCQQNTNKLQRAANLSEREKA